jgi:hypothetical protein
MSGDSRERNGEQILPTTEENSSTLHDVGAAPTINAPNYYWLVVRYIAYIFLLRAKRAKDQKGLNYILPILKVYNLAIPDVQVY